MEKVIKNFIPCLLLAIAAAFLAAWQFGIIVSAAVSGDYVSGDYVYRIDSGKAEIIDYNGNDSDKTLTIPSELDGYPVVSIGFGALISCGNNVEKINIPDSISDLSTNLFSLVPNLKSIEVSAGNQHFFSIDGVLFKKETEVSSFPGGAMLIEKKELFSFPSAKEIKSYIIPDGVTSIGENAFSGCVNLTDITIPDSVTSIGEHAFYTCIKLTNITIPDSVTSIGRAAFYGCHTLRDVYYSGSEAQWKKISIDNYNEDLIDAVIHYNSLSYAPTNVQATAGDKQIKLTWTAVSGAKKYRIQRSLSGKTWTTIAVVNSTSYTNTGLTNNMMYSYRVLASADGSTWSGASAVAWAAPAAATVSAPTNVQATAGDKQIKLTWTAVSGAAKYRVQRLNGSTWTTIATTSSTSYTNTGLTNGTKYSYRVLASADGSTWSSASAAASATPEAAVKVSAPTNFKATAGDKQVKLTWTAVSGAKKYRIQRLNSSTWTTIATTSSTSYTNTGLTNGTKYSYRVLASADGSAWSSASAAASATPAAAVKVSAPTNVKATAGDKQVKLTWTAVSGAAKYRVQRLNGSTWTTIATVSTNSYTNTGLTNGTKYSYRVLASADGSNWSAVSAVVSATPIA